MEESCFKVFKEQYEQLKKNLDDKKVPNEVKEILLQSCLDKWAFWLDEHSKHVRNLTSQQDKKNLHKLLDKFISQLKSLDTGYSENLTYFNTTLIIEHNSTSWLAWVEGNPIQMVKLGKYLSQNEQFKNAYKNAIELFDKVIKKELYFSEAARYYKAFALVKQVDWEQTTLKEKDEKVLIEFKQELREVARLLDEHTKFAINSASIISKIKKNNNESIIQIDAYEEQQKSLANLYYMFSRSIDDIFGHTITPQSFVNYDIKEELAESLYKDLLEKDILKKPRVEKNITDKELKVISSSYGISLNELKDFLFKFEGKDINEKEFLTSLKKHIELPDRIEFWKFLIQGEVLTEEVKFVAVNNEIFKEIDPLLLDYLKAKINKKDLETQSLELNNEQILLNAEWVRHLRKNCNIFKITDFKKFVCKDKYKVLKERGVLSFNRKAHINPSKIESITFPSYDSITPEDFTKVNITRSEAEKILADLEKQKIIETYNSDNSVYRLKIKFDEIKKIQLSFCPVYENVLKELLSTCFSYRISLQKIAVQLEERSFPVRLQLITKPHQSLFLELLEQKIIRPTMVGAKDEDLEVKLKSIYSTKFTKHNFKRILSQSKLFPEECIEDLFGDLVEKRWINKYDPMTFIPDEVIKAVGKENIKKAGFLLQDLYYISSPHNRKTLTFFHDRSDENVLLNTQSIDKTVEFFLNNRLQLSKEDTIKNVVSTLKRSRSALSALIVPDMKLKTLTEFCVQGNFANIEEVHLFFLNGLDQIIQLEEKKWTQKMLINTAIVIAMGISQIAVGTVIELFSVGIMTHVGAAFVSEGVNDIFFAASALKSGYFSWKDYRQHKLQSLMNTAVTVGVGAYLSRGTKVSRFGHKLAGPNFEFGKKVAEMSGTQLIQTAGCKIIGKEIAKRITLKTIEAVAFGLASAGVDILVENYLQRLCEGIASDISSHIERKVDDHNISINVLKAYEILGTEKAEKIINESTKRVFNRPSYVEEFLPIANKIASSVTQGIKEATKKISKTSKESVLPTNAISKMVVWSERSAHVANIMVITMNLLDNLDQELKRRLNKLEKDVHPNQKQEVEKDYKSFKNEVTDQWKSLFHKKANETTKRHIVSPVLEESTDQEIKAKYNLQKPEKDEEPYQKQKVEKDYESFKKEVIDQWKSLLREKAGQIIAQHIVSPVLKEGAHHLVRYVGKKVQERYQSYKESGYLERFEELKQEYKEKLQDEQQSDNKSKTKDCISKKYCEDLRKLMIKTRNPDLLADIVRENISMDMTCVSACTQVVHRILENQGIVITGLTIIVEGDRGIKQRFSSTSNETEGITIPLELKDNHFEFCSSSTSENSSNSKNNCLYEALAEALPGLKNIISPELFRDNVADCIKQDKRIRYHIQQGWHRLPISLGAFGGASPRDRSNLVHDIESSSFDNENEEYEEYRYREREISDHLEDRFTRYFRIGGMIQRASEQINVPRGRVVKRGASQFQDQTSNKGREIHASHLVRLGEINRKLMIKSEQLYNEFKNFLGHTQNVSKYANEWHGVGGDIDKFQSRNLKELGKINFKGSLTTDDASTIKRVKEDFISVLDKRINDGKFSDTQRVTVKLELIKLKATLTDMKVEFLFDKGKMGYSGEGMDAYRQ